MTDDIHETCLNSPQNGPSGMIFCVKKVYRMMFKKKKIKISILVQICTHPYPHLKWNYINNNSFPDVPCNLIFCNPHFNVRYLVV